MCTCAVLGRCLRAMPCVLCGHRVVVCTSRPRAASLWLSRGGGLAVAAQMPPRSRRPPSRHGSPASGRGRDKPAFRRRAINSYMLPYLGFSAHALPHFAVFCSMLSYFAGSLAPTRRALPPPHPVNGRFSEFRFAKIQTEGLPDPLLICYFKIPFEWSNLPGLGPFLQIVFFENRVLQPRCVVSRSSSSL